ncbi:MAG: tetratricopeptide repeat protein [Verrucomicrobiota bacterium]
MPAPVSAVPAFSPPASAARPRGLLVVVGAVLLALAVLLAWSNSFKGPFVLDDGPAIVDNMSIREWSTALSPPNHGETVTGRPLVNLSFALNRQLAGKEPRAADAQEREGLDKVLGYHVVNLAIHLGAALMLFGLVRRALAGPVLGGDFGAVALPLAFFTALLWAVHPLQTGAVTYIAQRAESLCALFYLLTLWCLARGAESDRPGRWLTAGVVACFGGMASKEVMVSAPLLALLFDRAFLAGSFGEAWRRRRMFYSSLMLSWGLLAGLAWHAGNRGGSAGFHLKDPMGVPITPWTYLLRQCEAIVHYLRLSVWPDALVSDYGFDVIGDATRVWPQGLLLLALLGATLWALWRRPAWGFLGMWFFAILAPSSSFIPVITETAAEHRMYLPLVAVVATAVLGIYGLARRLGRAGLAAAGLAGLVAAAVLGTATYRRNLDYASAQALWRDAATKRPDNARAHQELAKALAESKEPGRLEEALAEFREAIRLVPDYYFAYNNYGEALTKAGQLPDAIAAYSKALQLKPDLAEAWLGRGNGLANLGRLKEALPCFKQASDLKPSLIAATNNYARALDGLGQTNEALAVFEKLVSEHPDYTDARINLANLLGNHGRPADAIAHYRIVLQLRPDDQGVAVNLGLALFLAGRKAEAIAQLEAVLRADPGNADVRAKIENIRASGP